MATDWKILDAYIAELEELEDDLLRAARAARAGAEAAKTFLPALHLHIMEKRKRLREMRGN